MSIVDNHPATKPCAVSVQLLADTQAKLFEQTVLKEFLNEDESFDDTIENLMQLLERMACVNHCISRSTLFNARRALVSLETLKSTMEGKP